MIYAQIELEQAKTNLSMIDSNLKVRWRLLCKELNQKIENRERFKKINSTNTKRVTLDNKRFRLGRIKAFQWVQTEDDQASSYLRLQQAEVEVRLVAWEIQKITGKMAKQIQELLKVNNEQSN